MNQQIEYLRTVLDKDDFRKFCEFVREDVMARAKEISAALACDNYVQASGRIHALKGIFGDVGYEEGMRWCERVRRQTADQRIIVPQSELDEQTGTALKLIARLMEGPANSPAASERQ